MLGIGQSGLAVKPGLVKKLERIGKANLFDAKQRHIDVYDAGRDQLRAAKILRSRIDGQKIDPNSKVFLVKFLAEFNHKHRTRRAG